MDNEAGWRRVADAVRRRREERDWTQLDIAARGPMSIDRIQAIEGMRTDRYSARTITKLERALEWESGSVRAILAGGDPTLTGQAAPQPPAPTESDEELSPFERRILAEMAEVRTELQQIRDERRGEQGGEESHTGHG